MDLVIWLILVIIAISDAKKYRIPNSYLLVLIAVVLINKFVEADSYQVILYDLLAGGAFFFGSLALFFLRAIAPGDVKLLGAVGFWLGWGNLMSAVVWLAVSTVVVGVFYTLSQFASSGGDIRSSVLLMTAPKKSDNETGLTHQQLECLSQKVVMPFAPVIVIGLALNSYF